MNDEYIFEKTIMPSSRPAAYYLCLDGSVYLDFDVDGALIYLTRISFDGYGCCNIGEKSTRMSESDSLEFKKFFSADQEDQSIISPIVLKSIQMNADFIWNDALKQYRLI